MSFHFARLRPLIVLLALVAAGVAGLRYRSVTSLLGQAALQCDTYVCQDDQRPVMRITAIPWYHPAVRPSDGTGNQFGRAVADIGDFNGDGIHDLAVGTIADDDRLRSIRILLLNTNGTVKQSKTIAIDRASLTGYRDVHEVGISVAPLGDLDGDGVIDLAIGTSGVSDTGWPLWDAWTLFLRSDATVKSLRHIAGNRDLPNAGMDEAFGEDMVNIGDLDGDGVIDLAVTGPRRNAQTTSGGVLTIVFLNRDGSMKSNQRISGTEFGGLGFAISVAALGDYNNDGMIEVAVGSEGCEYSFTGGTHVNKNAVYILSLRNDGTVASSMDLMQPTNLPECTSPSPPLFTFGAALANVGDWNGDGVTDLAVSTLTLDQDYVWIALLNPNGGASYGKIPQEGNSQWWQRNMSGQEPMYFRSFGSALTSLPDRDGDGKRELVVGDILNTYCGPTYFAGSVWIYPTSRLDMRFSANAWEVRDMTFKTGAYCDSCRSSGVCPALVCGNGLPESLVDGVNEEQCGEPGLNMCGAPYTCQNCRCVASVLDGVASSSSTSSSAAVPGMSSSSFSSGTDGASSASSRSSSFSSSSSSSSTSLSAIACANGIIDPDEECEIGYSCPDGYTCNSSCLCAYAVSSSYDSEYSYDDDESSSSVQAFCGNGFLEGSEECEMYVSCATGQYCSNCVCQSLYSCGDGIVSAARGEECEADADCGDGSFCLSNCLCHADTGGVCGDGTLEESEECERNHPCDTGQQCQSCVCVATPQCGNGFLENAEQCEAAEACPSGLSCVNCLCQQRSACGNGVVEEGEECEEDSQCDADRSCSRLNCRCAEPSAELCGDGILEGGEQCELGQPCQSADEICNLTNCSCVLNAVPSLCGNAQVDAGEDCDISVPCAENEICNFAGCHCIPWQQRCGDAALSAGEECEIGSPCADPSKGCDMSRCVCANPSLNQVCGDGLVEIGEECEVGISCPFGWSCDYPHCRCLNQPVCGDAMLDAGEQCEINTACSGNDQICDFSRCRCVGNIVGCGNAIMDPGEQCDDGNTIDGDGCDSACQREWQTMVGGIETCGNGIVETTEQCDDGNTIDGDGCSHLCQREMSVAPGLGNPVWGSGEHAAGSQAEGGFLAQGGSTSGGMNMSGTQAPGSNRGAQTIVFPGRQGWNAAGGQQQTAFPSYYGSVVPYGPSGGPAGQTGPASAAVMAAGAAAGFAWVRRKKRA
ncbi:MAG: FG-GAP-like repeat-containing protein [Candidatus Peribacter sp.]|jgi:cysteine-rich repeat protein